MKDEPWTRRVFKRDVWFMVTWFEPKRGGTLILEVFHPLIVCLWMTLHGFLQFTNCSFLNFNAKLVLIPFTVGIFGIDIHLLSLPIGMGICIDDITRGTIYNQLPWGTNNLTFMQDWLMSAFTTSRFSVISCLMLSLISHNNGHHLSQIWHNSEHCNLNTQHNCDKMPCTWRYVIIKSLLLSVLLLWLLFLIPVVQVVGQSFHQIGLNFVCPWKVASSKLYDKIGDC